MATKHLIICGSPRAKGRSALIASQLYNHLTATQPTALVAAFCVCDHAVAGCQGCDACRQDYSCIIDDDMQLLYELLDTTDMIHVVSPVYFAGAPAQLKAVLDRMQPYFWENVRAQAKRPAQLYVVGEGGDPHGFDPLVGCVRSALGVAGFSLEAVHNLVACVPDPLASDFDGAVPDFITAALAGLSDPFKEGGNHA
ncbi:MAG: flavodoxin family protein [Raoultibacter sp.]